MRVADGIERVEGLRIGNAYLIEIDDGVVLVDTGMPGGTSRVLAALNSLEHHPNDIRFIVLTHWHPDHIGNAAEIRRLTGARIAIHELDAPVLAGGPPPAKGRRVTGLLLRALRVSPLIADVTLRSGDAIGGLEVIHAPGHTAGSIALRSEDRVLFSGDALVADRHGRLRPPDPALSLDPARASQSASALMTLGARLVLGGHGAGARGHR